ncbi:MAG: ATP-binding protein [Succinivibrio sp.]|nr:ATP-binding protein [Succinivibrio sp.]
MDLKELQKQFDEISKQVKRETKSQPALALLFTSLISLFKVLFEMLNAQTKTIDQLNNTIESLQQKLGNKTVDSKRANNENINSRGCEKKKIVDSSDKNCIKTTTKDKETTKVANVVKNEFLSPNEDAPWLYDDLRIIEPLTIADLDADLLDKYLHRVKEVKPRLAKFESEQIYNLTGLIKDNHVTLSALMIFHPNPQAIFPNFCIEATVVTGTQLGSLEHNDENIIKNKRIEGNILDMLEKTMAFIYQNLSVRTIINKDTLKRDDKADYPEIVLREAILNALVHRDYSIHSQNKPIEILMFNDRIEIKNPGSVLDNIPISKLGVDHPGTRNPILTRALEILGVIENRYSGIPTIQKAMKEYSLQPAEFTDSRGTFTVCLRKQRV